MNLRPYPEYTNTGLPWATRLPAQWKIKRGKSIFHCIDKRSDSGREELLTVSSARGVVPRRSASVTMFKAESYVGYKLCWPGDLVINSLWAWGGGLGVSQHHGIISSAYGVYRVCDGLPVNSAFIHELVRSAPFNWELKVRSKGIWISRLQLTDDSFLNAPFPLPPRDEQDAIVRFLADADQRISALIQTKRQLIGLLNEQKRGIIHRTVTRGIKSGVPLKSSGIPWLGDIPDHWKLIPLKFVSEIQSGITLGKRYTNLNLVEYPYLRVANVQAGHLILKVVKTIRLPVDEAKRSFLQSGDVLMTEGGDPDKLGRGCVWESQLEPCLHQNHVFAVRTDRKKLRPHFLAALLSSNYAMNYFLLTAKQTTNLASTNKSTIGRFRLLLPDLREQDEILIHLAGETGPLNDAIARAQREIDLIREYRTRLVADVVTGQIDVRAAAANLPAEIQAPEAAMEAEPEEEEATDEAATEPSGELA